MAVKKQSDALARNPLAERMLKQRVGRDVEVSLERLEADFADASRYDIVAALRSLEKAGRGQFLVGRRGQASRFVWRERPALEKNAKKTNATGTASASRAAADASVPAQSEEEEPAPKGSTRKALVPPGKPLDRTKLSTREAPQSAAGSQRPLLRSPPAPRPQRAASRTLQHSFHLRPGVLVTIDLPEDVTPTEVERFCSFLKALPFADATRG